MAKIQRVILYIIDTFSRFTQGYIIPDKTPDSVISPLLTEWIHKMFGSPDNILTDNGGEFHNYKMKDLCENYNIKLFTTGAHSPHQNGLNKRNRMSADITIEKLMEEHKVSLSDSLVNAAAWTHNTSINKLGYSPLLLVTGKAVTVPGLTT